MIIGLGSDLIDIRRIEQTIERHGERFLDRIFTSVERTKSDKRAQRAASYAKRFAAKEACSKALGTGLRRACSGATWAWSICPAASRPWRSPAGHYDGFMKSPRPVMRPSSICP